MLKSFRNLITALTMTAAFTTMSYARNTVEIVVGVPPGGIQDISARQLQKSLAEVDPTNNYVIVYKPGAGGAIAYNYGIQSQNANPNITMISVGAFTEITKNRELSEVEKEVKLIGPVWSGPNVLAVSLKSGISSLDELVKRGRDGRLTCGAPAQSVKLGLEYFKQQVGLKNTEIVLFKGTAEGMPLLLSGEIDCWLDTYPGPIENFHKSGQIKLIGSSDMRPTALFPDLPLMRTYLRDQSVHLFSWWLAVGISKNSPAGFEDRMMPILTRAINILESAGSVQVTTLDKADRRLFSQQYDSARKMNQSLAQ